MLDELIALDGMDKETISNVMNETFMTKEFTWKEVYERSKFKYNPNLRKDYLTKEEAKKVMKLVKE
jgi:hypothetical protein